MQNKVERVTVREAISDAMRLVEIAFEARQLIVDYFATGKINADNAMDLIYDIRTFEVDYGWGPGVADKDGPEGWYESMGEAYMKLRDALVGGKIDVTGA